MKRAQIEKYIKTGGGNCPFCDSADIVGGDRDQIDGREISLEARCEKCGKEWREYYKLHDMEERDAEGEMVNTTE